MRLRHRSACRDNGMRGSARPFVRLWPSWPDSGQTSAHRSAGRHAARASAGQERQTARRAERSARREVLQNAWCSERCNTLPPHRTRVSGTGCPRTACRRRSKDWRTARREGKQARAARRRHASAAPGAGRRQRFLHAGLQALHGKWPRPVHRRKRHRLRARRERPPSRWKRRSTGRPRQQRQPAPPNRRRGKAGGAAKAQGVSLVSERSTTENVLPLPSVLFTAISPPTISTTRRTSASPSPLPCVAWELSP